MQRITHIAESMHFYVEEIQLDNGKSVTLVGDKDAVEAIITHLETLSKSWAELTRLGFGLK